MKNISKRQRAQLIRRIRTIARRQKTQHLYPFDQATRDGCRKYHIRPRANSLGGLFQDGYATTPFGIFSDQPAVFNEAISHGVPNQPDGTGSTAHSIRLLDGTLVNLIRTVKIVAGSPMLNENRLETDDGREIPLEQVYDSSIPIYGLDELDLSELNSVYICQGILSQVALKQRGYPTIASLARPLGIPPLQALEPLAQIQKIVLWPDRNDIAYRHMTRIAAQLKLIGVKEIRIIRRSIAPHNGNPSNFSGDKKALQDLILSAVPWESESDAQNLGSVELPSLSAETSLRLSPETNPPFPDFERQMTQ